MLAQMNVPHIIGIGGTLRNNSTNLFALKRALRAAENFGATIELLDLNQLDLPLYRPGKDLERMPDEVKVLIGAAKRADAMIWSTASYHGTLAGVTKNALDYMEYLASAEPAYLDNKVVGLIATAGGEIGGVNAINSMLQVVHALRGTAIPLSVPISRAGMKVRPFDNYIEPNIESRLDTLGKLIYETAIKIGSSHFENIDV